MSIQTEFKTVRRMFRIIYGSTLCRTEREGLLAGVNLFKPDLVAAAAAEFKWAARCWVVVSISPKGSRKTFYSNSAMEALKLKRLTDGVIYRGDR